MKKLAFLALASLLLGAAAAQTVGPHETRTFRFASHVQKVENSGRETYGFSVLGSDGRHHNLKTLTARGPVLLVNLALEELPLGVTDLNRLERMMKGKVRVVGLVNGGQAGMRTAIERHGVRFLLLDDVGSIVRDHLPSDNGQRFYLSNGLLLPNGRITHVWSGYDRWTLGRMQADLLKHTKIRLNLELARFPKRLQLGSGGFTGLG
ncbi:hypothetical protein EON79_09230 [bacterium]|nr:MAG: hypothetical protein EON79_09230 [bacterium]